MDSLQTMKIQAPKILWERFSLYLDLLEKWNRVHNLTAIRVRDEQVVRHLNDCLAIMPYLSENQSLAIADIGTGAGFPGMVWAIARPDYRLFLVESNHKKQAFLREVVRQMDLKNVEVVAERVEKWQAPITLDLVVSRALASVDLFLKLSAHLGGEDTIWGIMKAHDEDCAFVGFEKTCVHKVQVLGLDEPRLWIELKRIKV